MLIFQITLLTVILGHCHIHRYYTTLPDFVSKQVRSYPVYIFSQRYTKVYSVGNCRNSTVYSSILEFSRWRSKDLLCRVEPTTPSETMQPMDNTKLNLKSEAGPTFFQKMLCGSIKIYTINEISMTKIKLRFFFYTHIFNV